MLEILLAPLESARDEPGRAALLAARPGRVREIGVRLLGQGLELKQDAGALLRSAFRRDTVLGSHDRHVVADMVYGAVRRLRLLRRLLSEGGWSGGAEPAALWEAMLVLQARVPPALAALDLPATVLEAVAVAPDTLRAWVARARPEPATLLGELGSLPGWLAERLLEELGEAEAASLAVALQRRAPVTLRVNPLKASPEQVRSALSREGVRVEPGRWAPGALHVQGRSNVFGLRSFHVGMYEVQDEGSQLIAELVQPPRRGIVVDFCAGAGGKTLAMAGAMPGTTRLWAFDVRRSALAKARRRSRRAGIRWLRMRTIGPEGPLPLPAGSAARVLVDAPCSGTGTLRRHPSERWRIQESDLEGHVAVQLAVLRRAAGLVRPGGRLVYATCSLLRAENEEIVEAFRAGAGGEWVLVPVKEVLGRERAERLGDGTCLRLYPHRHGTDGFFAAILQRRRRPHPVSLDSNPPAPGS